MILAYIHRINQISVVSCQLFCLLLVFADFVRHFCNLINIGDKEFQCVTSFVLKRQQLRAPIKLSAFLVQPVVDFFSKTKTS